MCVHTCAGNEAQGIVSGLHVLPEVNVGVVEDVLMQVEVVKALRRQYHANVVTCHHHNKPPIYASCSLVHDNTPNAMHYAKM